MEWTGKKERKRERERKWRDRKEKRSGQENPVAVRRRFVLRIPHERLILSTIYTGDTKSSRSSPCTRLFHSFFSSRGPAAFLRLYRDASDLYRFVYTERKTVTTATLPEGESTLPCNVSRTMPFPYLCSSLAHISRHLSCEVHDRSPSGIMQSPPRILEIFHQQPTPRTHSTNLNATNEAGFRWYVLGPSKSPGSMHKVTIIEKI